VPRISQVTRLSPSSRDILNRDIPSKAILNPADTPDISQVITIPIASNNTTRNNIRKTKQERT